MAAARSWVRMAVSVTGTRRGRDPRAIKMSLNVFAARRCSFTCSARARKNLNQPEGDAQCALMKKFAITRSCPGWDTQRLPVRIGTMTLDPSSDRPRPRPRITAWPKRMREAQEKPSRPLVCELMPWHAAALDADRTPGGYAT